MALDRPEHLGGKLRVEGGQLAGRDDAVQERLDELEVDSEVDAEVAGAGDELACGHDLVPVVEDAADAREEGVDAVGYGERLGRGRDGERVREAGGLDCGHACVEVGLEPADEGELTLGVEALLVRRSRREVGCGHGV